MILTCADLVQSQKNTKIYICNIYTNLPVNATVRLPHPRSGDNLGQETFLARSADKQTCNYDKGIEPQQQDEMVSDIYTNLPVNAIVRLPHPRSGDSLGQETYLAPSADTQTQNYDKECSNHHSSLSTLKSIYIIYVDVSWKCQKIDFSF